MQSPEDEMAGLGRGQRRRNRFEVAHLADEDHVRVLTQGGTERLREAHGIRADLALIDDAALVTVQELDRVLDREDVLGTVPVDLVDQRRERGRLTGAGRPGHEDEAARLVGEQMEGRRHAELLERLQLGGNQAKGGTDRLALEVDVDTEAREAGNRMREVELPLDLQLLLLLAREDAV